MKKLKLVMEFDTVSALASAVNKLGSDAENGSVKTVVDNSEDKSSKSGGPTKADLLKEANEKYGLDLPKRSTKAEIEEKIEEARTGQPAAQTQPQQPPAGTVPNVAQQPTQPAPQQPMQAAAQPAPQQPAQPVNREAILQDISSGLGQLAQKGVPEDQILPLVQEELKKIGAPINKRLSELEDNHLAAAHPGIVQALSAMLNSNQGASFV